MRSRLRSAEGTSVFSRDAGWTGTATGSTRGGVNRRIVAAALLVAAGGCTGTDVSVTGSSEGGHISAPPIEADVDKEGIKGPPTPTPGPITPIYPVATPNPTATPRPK